MLTAKPILSIIVPVYKVEDYLPACIDSILAQTFRDYELILVDDGSPDGCPALCDAAAAQDDRVRVIHQQNGGLSAARNAGLDAARGEWIGFVDSDDTIAPEMYERLYAAAEQEYADVAVCNFRLTGEAGNTIAQEWLKRDRISKREVLSGMEALRQAKRTTIHLVPNKIYRVELWRNLRFPVGKQNEDFFTLPLIFEKTSKMVCMPDEFYHYLQRTGSIMNGAVSLKRYDQAEAAAAYWQCLREYGQTDLLPRMAEIIFVSTMETYCALSEEDRKEPRSTQMRKRQYEIMRDTAKMQKMPFGVQLKSFLLSAAPQLYLLCRTIKTGK